jgi:hypothetical protein
MPHILTHPIHAAVLGHLAQNGQVVGRELHCYGLQWNGHGLFRLWGEVPSRIYHGVSQATTTDKEPHEINKATISTRHLRGLLVGGSRPAKHAPLHVGAQVFAAHEAVGGGFDLDAAAFRYHSPIGEPLIYRARRDTKRPRQFDLRSVFEVGFEVHVATVAPLKHSRKQ